MAVSMRAVKQVHERANEQDGIGQEAERVRPVFSQHEEGCYHPERRKSEDEPAIEAHC